MTITATDRRRTYIGNGATTAFNGPRAFKATHLQVYVGTDPAYALMPSTAYTVSDLGATQSVVAFNDPPALNADILILRTVPYDQLTDIKNQGAFLPEIHEDAFDYRVMQIQQLADGSLQVVQDGTGAFVWDAKGMRIVNVGDPVLDSDAVNLRTLSAYIDGTGGVVGTGVTPQTWDFTGDGVLTAFPIPGADVSEAVFYEVYSEVVAGSGLYHVALKPGADFLPAVSSDTGESRMVFTVAPAAGIRGFIVLRGYSKPYTGATPITTTAARVVEYAGNALTVDGTYQNATIVTTSDSAVTITLRANTGASVDWAAGQYLSIYQKGLGQVTLSVESGGALEVPTNFAAKTRAQGATINAECRAAGSSTWVASGDLLRSVSVPNRQAFCIYDGAALITTNIATGTGRGYMQMPFGFLLDSIASGGLYATLAVSQSAGNVVTVDVNRNGTSIIDTKLTFDNAEATTKTAATPAVFATNGQVLSAGDVITIDIDQIGTAMAKGLQVWLVGQRTS